MLGRATLWVAAVGVLCACGTNAPTPVDGPTPAASPSPALPPQTARLVEDLRQAGAVVQGTEVLRPESSYPWIPVPATRISVGDGSIAAFEYPTIDEVEAALRETSDDGHEFASAQVRWLSDPHIYRADRLIVLYVGTSPAMLDLLRRVLGPQVAGR